MKYSLCFGLTTFLFMISPCQAGFFDDLSREILSSLQQENSLDNNTIVKGLKEALATGTERAVTDLAKPDGYFDNQLIKILLPNKIQQAADLLGKVGYQQQIDKFVLSMNRAAEKATPKTASFFADAIRQMTVENTNKILNGEETAATKFFEKKTRLQLFNAFKPTVTKA